MHSHSMMAAPKRLTDAELVEAVTRLVRNERQATVSLIAHLMEFDARRLYLGAGHPSLFVYCTCVLRLSGHEAYHRIEAARLAQRFPVVLEMLGDGALNLTTARLLSSHLTPENHLDLLAAAAGRSKRQVEALLARLFPLPDVAARIRKLPTPPIRPSSPHEEDRSAAEPSSFSPAPAPSLVTDEPDCLPESLASPSAPAPPTRPIPLASPSRSNREVVRPLSTDRYELRLTMNGTTRDKLRLATDLLRHAVPDGDAAEIVDRALTALLERLAKQKFAATSAPRPEPTNASDAGLLTRHVPAAVRRAVWLRDGAQCAFVSDGGHRCRERGFLEFHHVHPYGVGGATTIDNLQLRCRAHNGYEAERFYGRRFVPGKAKEGRAQLGPDRVDAPLLARSLHPRPPGIV